MAPRVCVRSVREPQMVLMGWQEWVLVGMDEGEGLPKERGSERYRRARWPFRVEIFGDAVVEDATCGAARMEVHSLSQSSTRRPLVSFG